MQKPYLIRTFVIWYQSFLYIKLQNISSFSDGALLWVPQMCFSSHPARKLWVQFPGVSEAFCTGHLNYPLSPWLRARLQSLPAVLLGGDHFMWFHERLHFSRFGTWETHTLIPLLVGVQLTLEQSFLFPLPPGELLEVNSSPSNFFRNESVLISSKLEKHVVDSKLFSEAPLICLSLRETDHTPPAQPLKGVYHQEYTTHPQFLPTNCLWWP